MSDVGEFLPAALRDVHGLIPDEEGLVLADLASRVEPGHAIVEVGSYQGKSTCYLAAGAVAGHGAHVYAFDPWGLAGNPPGRHGYNDAARAAFDAHVDACGLSGQITATQAFSAAAADDWDGPIGLLFIDGDHSYDAVINDFWSWWPHLVRGAVVAFDDYRTPRNPGVEAAVGRLSRLGHLRDVRIEVERLAVGIAK